MYEHLIIIVIQEGHPSWVCKQEIATQVFLRVSKKSTYSY